MVDEAQILRFSGAGNFDLDELSARLERDGLERENGGPRFSQTVQV